MSSTSQERIPTARVRSVGDVQAMQRAGLPPLALEARAGEYRRVGLAAVVKDTVLEAGQTKSVSMPSEVFLDAGVDVERIEGRAGSVNERRPWVEACGAYSGIFEDAGRDMMDASCTHGRLIRGWMRGCRESVQLRRTDCTAGRLFRARGWWASPDALQVLRLAGRFEFHLISSRPLVALLTGAFMQQRDATDGGVEQTPEVFFVYERTPNIAPVVPATCACLRLHPASAITDVVMHKPTARQFAVRSSRTRCEHHYSCPAEPFCSAVISNHGQPRCVQLRFERHPAGGTADTGRRFVCLP
jgi:hypothetical protein